MGRAPCCDKANVKKGPWSPEEDAKLKDYIHKHGTGGNWITFPQKAGLKRCGKSCRLRWLNYLRPDIKHGDFSDDEDKIIYRLFAILGSRWSIIAAQLPGRTDNDIKNYWNTKLRKKLMGMVNTHQAAAAAACQLLPCNNNNNPQMPSLSFECGYGNYYPYSQIRGFSTRVELEAMSPSFRPISTNSSNFNGNSMIYGGDQPSCSSSENSSFQGFNLGNFNGGHVGGGEDHKLLIGSGDGYEMNYSVEEIKELIGCCTNNNGVGVDNGSSSSFLMDGMNMAIKTEENPLTPYY